MHKVQDETGTPVRGVTSRPHRHTRTGHRRAATRPGGQTRSLLRAEYSGGSFSGVLPVCSLRDDSTREPQAGSPAGGSQSGDLAGPPRDLAPRGFPQTFGQSRPRPSPRRSASAPHLPPPQTTGTTRRRNTCCAGQPIRSARTARTAARRNSQNRPAVRAATRTTGTPRRTRRATRPASQVNRPGPHGNAAAPHRSTDSSAVIARPVRQPKPNHSEPILTQSMPVTVSDRRRVAGTSAHLAESYREHPRPVPRSRDPSASSGQSGP